MENHPYKKKKKEKMSPVTNSTFDGDSSLKINVATVAAINNVFTFRYEERERRTGNFAL